MWQDAGVHRTDGCLTCSTFSKGSMNFGVRVGIGSECAATERVGAKAGCDVGRAHDGSFDAAGSILEFVGGSDTSRAQKTGI